MHNIPLGQMTEYRFNYDASLLAPIPRTLGRQALSIDASRFVGADLWNAYELSWLNTKGLPQVRVACLTIPCDSVNIVESKSLKLYFNGFNQTLFDDEDVLIATIKRDLSVCVGCDIEVELFSPDEAAPFEIQPLQSTCLDNLDVVCDVYDTDAHLLREGQSGSADRVHSHLLRSLCPVTGQPDWATVIIDYEGCSIERGSLLQYIVSFRNHQDFHELCVERIFTDLMQRFNPEKLTVYARYLRRGGIDISPYRSTHQIGMANLRTLRQ